MGITGWERVRHGGHNIALESIIIRYPRSIDNLVHHYAPLCDSVLCLDNSQNRNNIIFTQTHLVGFSLGGLIAQQVAIEAYDRLLSLVLIGTIAGRSEEEKQRVAARAELLEKGGAQAHLVAAGERWFTDDFRRANPEVIKKRKQKSLCNDLNCYVAAYRVLAENDLVDDLHKITTPTLAITGEFDAGSTPRMSNMGKR